MSSFNFHFESHIRAPFIPFIVVARALRLSADCSFPGFGFGFGLVWFGSVWLLFVAAGSAFGFCHGSAAVSTRFNYQLPRP